MKKIILGNIKIITTKGLGNELFFYLFYLNLKSMKFNPSLISISGISLDKILNLTDETVVISNGYLFYKSITKISSFWAYQYLRIRSLFMRFFSIIQESKTNHNLKLVLDKSSILPSGLPSGFYTETTLMNLLRNNGFEIIDRHRNYTFSGYWGNKQFLKEELVSQIRSRLFDVNLNISKNLFNSLISDSFTPVAVHIRGGDFNRLKNFNFINVSYYNLAIEKVNNILNTKTEFFIFTDDLDKFALVESAFFNQNYRLVSSHDFSKDFYLLMQFTNFILSNSTFSLWASILSNFEGKIIIRPTPLVLGLEDTMIFGNEILISYEDFKT